MEAFCRHSRPQPSVFGGGRIRPNLREGHNVWFQRNKNEQKDLNTVAEENTVEISQSSPWTVLSPLGELSQGSLQFVLCMKRSNKADLIMMKRDSLMNIRGELEVLQSLSHPKIDNLISAFIHEDKIYLGFEYLRCTLEDLLHVHLPFEEPQLEIISSSVFEAIKYLSAEGFTHGNIRLQSIKICEYTASVKLGDFSKATRSTHKSGSRYDLESLGLVMLQCMEGGYREKLDDIDFVRSQRNMNKVFGLLDSEPWSDSQVLLDFLDEIFNESKSTSNKLEKPHQFVATISSNPHNLRPFAALVPLECLALWSSKKSAAN